MKTKGQKYHVNWQRNEVTYLIINLMIFITIHTLLHEKQVNSSISSENEESAMPCNARSRKYNKYFVKKHIKFQNWRYFNPFAPTFFCILIINI